MTRYEMEQQIKEQLEAAFVQAEIEFDRNFPRITVKFNLTSRTAGQFKYRYTATGSIFDAAFRFNIPMALENQDDFESTIVHELAHYITALKWDVREVASHGYEWKSVMRRLGEEPTRTHEYALPQVALNRTPYMWTCPCNIEFHFSKRKHDRAPYRGYTCNACGGALRFSKHLFNDSITTAEKRRMGVGYPILRSAPVITAAPPEPTRIVQTTEWVPSLKDLTPRKSAPIQPYMSTVSLSQAQSLGFVLYWNGKTCLHGHKSVRYASDGNCKECYKLHRKDPSHYVDKEERR